MLSKFVFLCLQTIILWLLVVYFHRKKTDLTLIPLYAYIAILTIFTHNFSDLGFAVTIDNWFFLISSFSFFTTLMFGVLYLYLFEGPRAARASILIIVFSSLFYIAIVYLTGLETNTSNWVKFDTVRATYYFWSILAIIMDAIFLAIAWELLSKIKSLPLILRVFLITFAIFSLDTLIFTTGVFSGTPLYPTVLKGDLLVRLLLSLIGAPIITYFLKAEGFAEENREKPKKVWEILNFRSDLELKIVTLESAVKQYKDTKDKLSKAEETYKLVINGIGAGIWDWDVITNKIEWSPKFYSLLGYSPGELKGSLDSLKEKIHPEDFERTFSTVNQHFKDHTPLDVELRIKTKSGDYRWYMASGITKYNEQGKPIRMIGSVIDISNRKEIERELKDKLKELTEMNSLMVNRELKMIELKEENISLKKKD